MKTVVFDMDGVLFDTEILCMKSWMAIAEKWGMPLMEEVFPKCIGRNANDSKRIVLETYGEDFNYPDFREEASQWFWEYISQNGLPVKPGARQLLEWLNGTGYTVGLASSTKSATVFRHMEQSGLGKFFSVVVTGDMVEHSKPLPDIYLLACRKLHADPSSAYAIEDSPNGIRSAHAAGMHPLMVPDMIAPDEEMRRLSDEIFQDLTEVLAYLRSRAR